MKLSRLSRLLFRTICLRFSRKLKLSRKKPRLAPGEMENVVIKNDVLKGFEADGVIEISVEG